MSVSYFKKSIHPSLIEYTFCYSNTQRYRFKYGNIKHNWHAINVFPVFTLFTFLLYEMVEQYNIKHSHLCHVCDIGTSDNLVTLVLLSGLSNCHTEHGRNKNAVYPTKPSVSGNGESGVYFDVSTM